MSGVLSANIIVMYHLVYRRSLTLTMRMHIGYVTENSGAATITSGNTSIAANHGLSITPNINNISVTPTSSLGSAASYWVSGVTSTQFTINVNANPGQSVTFSWAVGSI